MPLLAESILRPYWAYQQVIYVPFLLALGAIVGSFLNVVILRLPARQNIISPPSSCPMCRSKLRWFENLPIVGWLRLRGRCGHCGTPISVQYPLIELLCALTFGFLFVVCYIVQPGSSWLGELVPAWMGNGPGLRATWPLFTLWLILLMALLAMTVIDFRTYTIPIEITWVVTISAFLVHALMPIWPGDVLRVPLTSLPAMSDGIDLGYWTIPLAGSASLCSAVGGMAGIGISVMLMRANVLRYSFLDFDFYVGPEDPITAYPHPRRELEWELDFLAPIGLGVILGWWIGQAGWIGALPLWAASLGGSLVGYFVGAGLIWMVRVLGTLAFGKEAMGLGDAHMLACIGAVLGWVDAVLVFFLAPFLAIGGMVITSILSRFVRGFAPYVPYGPWLAAATVVVLLGDGWLEVLLEAIMNAPVNLP